MNDFFPDKPLAEQPPASLLALTLWGEARGEPVLGKRAVAWVVRNRMSIAEAWLERKGRQHPLFGDGTVAGVVLRPYQFSCWLKGDPNSVHMHEAIATEAANFSPGLWAILKAVAKGVLADVPEWADPTYGATHYCTKELWGADNPKAWHGKQEIESGRTVEKVVINNHVFARVA